MGPRLASKTCRISAKTPFLAGHHHLQGRRIGRLLEGSTQISGAAVIDGEADEGEKSAAWRGRR